MNTSTREAAVATIIIPQPAAEVLVLKRNSNPRDPWSGHYAFPGGRRDAADSSLLDTCIRETYEECGVELSLAFLVKKYPVRQAGNHLGKPVAVTTYLFELPDHPAIKLQETEISYHEWLSLDYISDNGNVVNKSMSPRYPDKTFPCIPATLGFVWGFTYETLRMVISDQYNGSYSY